MIVTLETSTETKRLIARHQALAGRTGDVMADALETTAMAGAEDVRRQLVMGERGLTMQHPGDGMAASVDGWMLDRSAPLAAIGVPTNSPAIGYAGIQEHGGVIRPTKAKALAVPISEAAKQYTTPRDMDGLSLIKRKGKASLLAEVSKSGKMIPHWILLASVTIRPTHWLSEGVDAATVVMVDAFADRMGEFAREW